MTFIFCNNNMWQMGYRWKGLLKGSSKVYSLCDLWPSRDLREAWKVSKIIYCISHKRVEIRNSCKLETCFYCWDEQLGVWRRDRVSPYHGQLRSHVNYKAYGISKWPWHLVGSKNTTRRWIRPCRQIGHMAPNIKKFIKWSWRLLLSENTRRRWIWPCRQKALKKQM